MVDERYRALIVDDDQTARSLTVRAMNRKHFICDEVADGYEALAICKRQRYDLVVTDLKMPDRHGYQLACDLLDREDRPMIAVLTGVLEPRLAKELYTRGVDHIEFKPVDYDAFAMRVKTLVAQQVRAATPPHALREEMAGENQGSGSHSAKSTAITIGDVEARLTYLAGIRPMSQAAIDVVDVVRAGDSNATQIAAAIARDASLAVEVLKRANSSFYNPSGERVVSLEQAVVRIGTRRVGELALAATVLTSLTTSTLPWMDVDLAWKRSIAAGLAVDWILDRANLCDHLEGLFLCALMHGLGRIALATLFPEEYQSMVDKCRENRTSLHLLEKEVFPESAVETMIRLLSIWNVPTADCEPLKHLSEDYAALSCLDESAREKAELLKLGVLVGQMTVREWEPWDLVELPPASATERLNVVSVSAIVDLIKSDLFEVVNFRKHATARPQDDMKSGDGDWPRLSYCRSPHDPLDFLSEIIRSLDIQLVPRDIAEIDSDEPAVINGCGLSADELSDLVDLRPDSARKRLIISDDNQLGLQRVGSVVRLPCSIAELQSRLQSVAASASADPQPAQIT